MVELQLSSVQHYGTWREYVSTSAKTLPNFMSAYAVFLAPIAGIMLTVYWFIKRRNYDAPALYDPRGIYHPWVSSKSPSPLVLLIYPIYRTGKLLSSPSVS